MAKRDGESPTQISPILKAEFKERGWDHEDYGTLGPIKGGGGKSKGRTFGHKPPEMMRGLLEKFLLPLLRNLRAGVRNWITTIAGVAVIVLAIFGGDDVNLDQVLIGIAAIFARDAGRSSEESAGIVPEVVK